MKKKLLILLFVIIMAGLCGCSKINDFTNKNKPSINFYTQNLTNNLALEKPLSIKVFYKEYFNEFIFPDTEVTDILSFINILNDKYFIDKPSDLPDSYKYKVYLEFNDSKYAMTIFNEKYISIYSWDGKYEVDYVNMSDIPLHLNLYSICKYFSEK